jgi:hypothetical protein
MTGSLRLPILRWVVRNRLVLRDGAGRYVVRSTWWICFHDVETETGEYASGELDLSKRISVEPRPERPGGRHRDDVAASGSVVHLVRKVGRVGPRSPIHDLHIEDFAVHAHSHATHPCCCPRCHYSAEMSALISRSKGEPEPDPDLRDNENVPLPAIPTTWEADPTERLATVEYRTAIDDYMTAEVLPYVPDAWVDHEKTKLGYEIPLTRHFYKYVPPRPLAEIDAEIKTLETEIQALLREVTE